MDEFQRIYNGEGTALELVQMVTETFPSFRDEVVYNGKKGKTLLISPAHTQRP